jgi:hypothetical protein
LPVVTHVDGYLHLHAPINGMTLLVAGISSATIIMMMAIDSSAVTPNDTCSIQYLSIIKQYNHLFRILARARVGREKSNDCDDRDECRWYDEPVYSTIGFMNTRTYVRM